MSVDISDAILNLVNTREYRLTRNLETSGNRINDVGVGLEEYVKDLFANTFSVSMGSRRNNKLARVFSYLGSKNKPPDIMLRSGGAAIEVKCDKEYWDLQFKYSYPRRTLLSNDIKINNYVKSCETWNERDMLYVIGIVKKNEIRKLCMVFGTEIFTDNKIYFDTEQRIKKAVCDDTVDFQELRKCQDVDPLHISSLRVRGMWLVKNPFVVFSDQFNVDNSKKFTFVSLIANSKYNNLNHKNELETLRGTEGFSIENVNISDPNNVANEIACKLIKYEI